MSDCPPDPECQTPARSSWRYPAIVLVPVFLAYLTSFAGAFVFDDVRHIVNNDLIKDFSRLPEMLASRRPVVTLSLAFNHAIGGLNTPGYHALNLLVHLSGAYVLFDLVRRTLLLERFTGRYAASAAPIAAACALLWGVHPLTTQAVTYIIQRGESMASLCYLLVLYSLVRAAGAKVAANWLALGVVACALGLGSKAIVATAPILALFFDRAFLSGSFLGAFRSRWPFYLGLCATWGLLLLNGLFASIFLTDPGANPVNNVGFGMTNVHPFDYAITQPGVVWHYIRLAFVPIGQVIDDRLAFVHHISPLIAVQGGVLVLAGIAGLFASLKGRAWGFVVLAFFLILAPTSSIIPIRDAAYEHRMYLPLAALIVGVVCAAWNYLPVLRAKNGIAIVSVLAVVLAGVTATRNLDYQSRLSIWQDTLEKRPHNDRAMLNIAMQLVDPAEGTEADYPGAIEYFNRAIEIESNTLALRWLGIAQAQAGDIEAAERSMRAALRGRFQTPVEYARYGQRLLKLEIEPLYDVAVIAWKEATYRIPQNVEWRMGLAEAQRRSGDAQGAMTTTQELTAVMPTDPVLLFNLASDMQASGNTAGAIENYNKVLEIDPGNLAAAVKLAEIKIEQGEIDEARSMLLGAVESADQASEVNMAGAYFVLGRAEEAAANLNAAITAYIQSVELDDQFLEPVINLANLLEKSSRNTFAYEYYDNAIANVIPTEKNAPLRARLLSNYGNCLARAGRFIDAMPLYDQAIEVTPKNPVPMRGLAYAQWQAGLLEDAMDTCNVILQIIERDETAVAYARTIAAQIAERDRANRPIAP